MWQQGATGVDWHVFDLDRLLSLTTSQRLAFFPRQLTFCPGDKTISEGEKNHLAILRVTLGRGACLMRLCMDRRRQTSQRARGAGLLTVRAMHLSYHILNRLGMPDMIPHI